MLEREWNIGTIAKLAELPHSTINKIVLKGRVSPSMVTVHLIATAFKMSIVEFLDTPEINALTKEDLKMMKNYKIVM